MALPIIAYHNILRNTAATLTDPGTASGFSLEDIKDYKPWKIWKSDDTTSPINIDIDLGVGNTGTADYVMLVNHNMLANGATVTVQSDNDVAFGSPTALLAATAPDSDDVWFKGFTVGPAERYFRVILTDPAAPFAAAPFIGELFLGLRTTLTEYMNPDIDPFMKGVEAQSNRSEGGQYLGSILRGKTHRFTFSFSDAGAARSAFTSDLNTFIDDHVELRRPFGFVLDTADSDFDQPVYLKMTDGTNVQRKAVGGVWSRLTWTFDVEEAFSESAT
jgi:hypothetical protein